MGEGINKLINHHSNGIEWRKNSQTLIGCCFLFQPITRRGDTGLHINMATGQKLILTIWDVLPKIAFLFLNNHKEFWKSDSVSW